MPEYAFRRSQQSIPCHTDASSFSIIRRPPTSTLFPYTTLFRSQPRRTRTGGLRVVPRRRYVRHVHRLHCRGIAGGDRKSTRLNSSHPSISYAVFCLKKKIIYPSLCLCLCSSLVLYAFPCTPVFS